MGELIKSPKIISKDGEFKVHIILEINLNINSSEVKQEKAEWIIPEFGVAEKIEFGKKES